MQRSEPTHAYVVGPVSLGRRPPHTLSAVVIHPKISQHIHDIIIHDFLYHAPSNFFVCFLIGVLSCAVSFKLSSSTQCVGEFTHWRPHWFPYPFDFLLIFCVSIPISFLIALTSQIFSSLASSFASSWLLLPHSISHASPNHFRSMFLYVPVPC